MDIFNKIARIKEENSKTERCVACGVDTSIPTHYPIDLRNFYVEGAGQLCRTCWDEVYEK